MFKATKQDPGTGRRTWWGPVLPIGFLSLILFGFVTLSSPWSISSTSHSVLGRTLEGWVSPHTIRTIERDESLRRNYLDLLGVTARGADWLAERYPDLELQDTSDALKLHIRELTELRNTESSSFVRRQLGGGLLNATESAASGFISDQLSKLTNSLIANAAPAGMFLGIGIGEGTATGLNLSTAANAKRVGAKVAAANNMEKSGIDGLIENTGNGLMGTLLGSVDLKALAANSSAAIAEQAGPAAQGLATGIGNGFVQGFQLGKPRPATLPNQGPAASSIKGPGALPNQHPGASPNQRPGALPNQLPGVPPNPHPEVSPNQHPGASVHQRSPAQPAAAKPAAAQPAAVKAAPSQSAAAKPPAKLDVPDVLNKFGFGLVDTVASNIDTQKIKAQLTGNKQQIEKVKAQLAPAALGFSSGLSGGIVNGLRINQVAPPQGSDVGAITGAFGYGLTNTVATNINMKQVAEGIRKLNEEMGLNREVLLRQLPAAASGLGTGLGLGASVGLGAQPDPGELPVQRMPPGQVDTAGVARNFAFGLSSRFLGNNTLGKIAANPSLLGVPAGGASSPFANVNYGKVAGGLARGLVQGAGDGITAMGGLQAIIDGNAANVTDVPLTPISMDDSVGGAAVGLGQGLGSQGVAVGKVLVSQVKLKFTHKKREIGSDAAARELQIRQAPPDTTPSTGALSFLNGTTLNISQILSAGAISSAIQATIDTVSCEGIGGFALIGVGLVKSGTIKLDDDLNLTAFKDLLPSGTIHFNNAETNNYELDMKSAIDSIKPFSLGGINKSFRVNGNGIVVMVALLVLHIGMAIGVLLTLLPLVVGLESTQNLLTRVGKAHVLAWSDKWVNISWIFLIAPSIIIVLVTGVVAKGNASHMQNAHGILGVLTILLALLATAMHFVVKMWQVGSAMLANLRRVVLNLLMLFIVVASMLGFSDLSALTVCLVQVVPFALAVSLGFGVAGAFSIGSAIAVVDAFWAMRKPKKAPSVSDSDSDAPGAKDLEMSGGASESKKVKLKISSPIRSPSIGDI